MLEINYVFRAKSPLFTGAGASLGIKSELRKQKVKIANPTKIASKFNNETDRENAYIDILAILYSHLSPEYRLKRGVDIWKEFKSGVLSCAGTKSISNFISRFANRFVVSYFDTDLLKYLDLFSDVEFLQYLTDNIDYLLTKMRFVRENKNANYKRIKEIDKELIVLMDKIDKNKDTMFYDGDEDKKKYDLLVAEQKELEINKAGFVFDIEHYKSKVGLFYQKDFESVPLFTGNAIGGIMRRLTMADFLQRIDVNSVCDFTYHTLFTGGTLTDKVNDEFVANLEKFIENLQDRIRFARDKKNDFEGVNGEIVIEKTEKLAFYCPPLRLFGAATKGGMISSEMIVSNARLKCAENGNGESSLWSLIEDTFFTRHDTSKGERNIEIIETSPDAHQMKYITETLIEGSEFEHGFILKTENQNIYDCFHASLKLFADYQKIGGKSARGFGDIDLTELVDKINYNAVTRYYSHLEENKEEIRKFLGV